MKKIQDMDKDQGSELLPNVFYINNYHTRNPPSPPFDKGGLGGFQRIVAWREFSLPNVKSLRVSSPKPFSLFGHEWPECSCLEFEYWHLFGA
jgi:hypothetical protein